MYKKAASVAIVASLAFTIPSVAEAQDQVADRHPVSVDETHSPEDVQQLIDATQVELDGNIAIIEGPSGVTTVTKNADGSVTVKGTSGKDTYYPSDLVSPDEQNISNSPFRNRQVVRDWKRYLCAAAAAATVEGHNRAWAKALQLVAKAGQAHPVARIALWLGHFGASVFLSTQC